MGHIAGLVATAPSLQVIRSVAWAGIFLENVHKIRYGRLQGFSGEYNP